jgi:hypothetical protein
MATYLQGVTDYIPQIQPFQPNINLMANVLQTKQSQYDSNHKAINNVYSQLIHADLSREDNQERRDELVKAIDFNLKKISGMDLSLQQNVRQAKQLFTPFYEDKYLMKDIAFTKNYRTQYGRAMALKNSTDEKQRAMYWETGIKAMDYKVKEFQNVDLESSLSFGNVAYTNYVNTTEKALDLAKKAGLSIESVEFSPDGRWIIKNTNGEALREPLSKLFQATLAKDPAIQAVYQTQAYVNRKDYASVNASMFGGDESKAEIRYLQEQLENQGIKLKKQYEGYRERSNVYQNNIAKLESDIAAGKAKPGAEKMLRELKSNKQINDVALQRLEEVKEQIEGSESSTLNTNNGFRNPYGDIETLRRKVDGAVANDLLFGDLNQAAETFAYRNFKQDIQANPYKIMEIKHQNALALERQRATNRARLAEAKENARRKFEIDKMNVENGLAVWDPQTGNAVPLPGLNNPETAFSAEGTTEADISYDDIVKVYNSGAIENIQTVAGSIGGILDTHFQEKNITAEDFENITGLNRQEYFKTMRNEQKALEYFTPEKLKQISNNFKKHYQDTGRFLNDSEMSNVMNNIAKAEVALNSYDIIYKEHHKWNDDITEKAKSTISNKSFSGLLSDRYSALDNNKAELFELYFKAQDAGQNLSADHPAIREFANELMNRGLIVPDLNKIAQEEWKKIHGTNFRPGTGSQVSIPWEKHKNEIAKSIINPETGKNFNNANEYQRYQNNKVVRGLGDTGDKAELKFAHDIYQKLNKTFESERMNLMKNNVHPLLPAYGSFDVMGNSVFGTDGLKITAKKDSKVNHLGLVTWNQFYSDFSAMDIDGSRIKYSLEGMTPSGIQKFKDMNKNNEAKRMVSSFIQYLHNESEGAITMEFFDVANNKLNEEAMIIRPTQKDLNNWKKTFEAAGEFGVLSEDDANVIYNQMINNGISIIAPDKTFKNNLAATGRTSMLERAVDALPKDTPFKIEDYNNENNYVNIFKSEQNPGTYDVVATFQIQDFEDPSRFVPGSFNIPVQANLEATYDNSKQIFDIVNALNTAAENQRADEYQRYMQILLQLQSQY